MAQTQIKASEISEILLSELRGIDNSLKFQEVGSVLMVSDGVARIFGLVNAEAGELLEFDSGVKGVVMNLEADNVGAVLLVNGAVTGVITRVYKVTKFQPHDITVYVNTDNVGWSSLNFWTWGGDETHGPKNPAWPGDKITATTVIDGKTWYYNTYRMNSSTDSVRTGSLLVQSMPVPSRKEESDSVSSTDEPPSCK